MEVTEQHCRPFAQAAAQVEEAELPQAPPAWEALSRPLIASCSPSPPQASRLLPTRRDANGNREAGHLLEAHAPHRRGRLARGARGSATSPPAWLCFLEKASTLH